MAFRKIFGRKKDIDAPNESAGIQVHTEARTWSDRIFRDDTQVTEELNPDRKLRSVFLVWRAIHNLEWMGELGGKKWWSHWAIEVEDAGCSDRMGYVWELSRAPTGEIHARGVHWAESKEKSDKFKRGPVEHKGVTMTTDLTDMEIQEIAGTTLSYMKRPPTNMRDDAELYKLFQNNCQHFARALAINITKHPRAQQGSREISEAFFEKQRSFKELGPVQEQRPDAERGGWTGIVISGALACTVVRTQKQRAVPHFME